MKDMNPFHFKKYIYRMFRFENIKDFSRRCKWSLQRINEGVSDFDAWDLDCFLADVMIVGLRKLAACGNSYPGTKEFPTYESWHDYLLDTAYLIEYGMDDDWDNPCPRGTQEYFEYDVAEGKRRQDMLNKGLDQLVKVFRHLWD